MISIVIPTLNEAATIERTLQRIRSLGRGIDVIVVDGGSADDTAAIASRYATVLHAPRGRARQMNAGAATARGDILLFLHADTILPAGAIGAIEEALSDQRVTGGRFKVALDHPGLAYRLVAHNINLRDRLFAGFTGDQGIFVRSSVFSTLGGYREIPLMEDLDFAGRLRRAGQAVILPLKVTTSARRWQRNGLARTVLLMWLLRLLFVLGFPPARLKKLYGDTR